ncbi:putative transmembrane protein [Toxoplasma gondii VAND]|uniref:Putative transmembrane protein n=1 Tax=Toxoplasma gondii VAND TaxID=933077 RepID=A0A086PKZ9_TOXGO|nr:putative transmembrane protein [Toxoplasma gondii VAND]
MVNRSSGTSHKWLFRFLTAAFLVACFIASLAREAAAADNVDSEAPIGKNDPSQGSSKEENVSSEDDVEVEENTTEELGSLAENNWMDVFAAIDALKGNKPAQEAPQMPRPPTSDTNKETLKPASSPAAAQVPAETTQKKSSPPGADAGATVGANAKGKTATGVGGSMGPLLEKLAAKLNMESFYSDEDEEEEPEEDEEEALAETIIHGSKKKTIPRVRTAVDDLIDEIEKEKIRKIAKTDRHFHVLLERKKESDKKREADSVKPPQYFRDLAHKAAEYHKTLYQEQQKRDAGKVLTPGQQRARKRAHRRSQKDKLLAWRRSQFAQVASTPAQRQQHLASTRQESRDIDKTIDDDLDELDWGEILKPSQPEQSSNEVQDQPT